MEKHYFHLPAIGISMIGAVLLSACAAFDYDLKMVEGQAMSGDAFKDALHKEYLALAVEEDAEDDWKDAAFFAKRASDAASGIDFGPQEISERNIPDANRKEIGFARSRLINALATDKMGANAAHVARAQAKFDCWLQEQEENNQPADIAKCRADFDAALASMMVKAMPAPAAAPAAPAPAPKMAPKIFVIYFDFDSAALTPEANRIIGEAILEAKTSKAKSILVAGHADTSGSQAYNNALSQKRAVATAETMTWAGMDKKMVKTAMFGEDFNAVTTGDGVKNDRNRRVEIKLSY